MGRVLVKSKPRVGKLIGSVCHGPAALLAATDDDGRWPFRRVAA